MLEGPLTCARLPLIRSRAYWPYCLAVWPYRFAVWPYRFAVWRSAKSYFDLEVATVVRSIKPIVPADRWLNLSVLAFTFFSVTCSVVVSTASVKGPCSCAKDDHAIVEGSFTISTLDRYGAGKPEHGSCL